MKKLILYILCSLAIYSSASAQTQTTINEVEKQTLKDFEGNPIQKGQGYSVYKRWDNYWRARVGENGTMPAQGHIFEEWMKMQTNKNIERGNNDSGNWVSIGFNSSTGGYSGIGRVNCVAFHPTDSNIFWVGTPAGGIWKTTNYGKNWTPLSDFLPQIGVSDIVVDYKNTNVIYIATGDRDYGSFWGAQGPYKVSDTKSVGVWKTIDGGVTWKKTGLNYIYTDFALVNRLKMHPTKHNTLWAATTTGIYITNDSGVTWSKTASAYFIDLELKPNNPNTIYAASYDATNSNSQIYRSIDAGLNWAQVSNFTGAKRINIEVTPASNNLVHALICNSSKGLLGLFKSTDSGTNWTQYIDGSVTGQNYLCNSYGADKSGGQGTYDLAFAINPKNANELYLGGVITWYSTNGGASWNVGNNWYGTNGTYPTVHADKHYMAYHPLAKSPKSVLFETNDGGIYYTRNPNSWTDLTNGLNIGAIYRLSVSQTASDVVLCGHQDNGTKKRTATLFDDTKGGDGMECIIDYSNVNYMYASSQYGDIERSSDGFATAGVNISGNIPGAPKGDWITPYIMDPKDPKIIFAGYTEVYKTTDRGTTWTAISSNLTGSTTRNLNTMAIAPSDAKTIYAATWGNMWRTTDGGATTTWTKITGTLPMTDGAITYITVNPTDPKTVYVTIGSYTQDKKVYKSVNGGTNWSNISGTKLPNVAANCIIHDGKTTNGLYIGTDLGVYFRNDNMSDWIYFSRKLPVVPIGELEIQKSTQKIRAGTFGRGLWESNMWNATAIQPPKAKCTVDDSTICQGGTVKFTSITVGATSVSWIFEDGSPAASPDTIATVKYFNYGTKKVTFIATGPGGNDTLVRYIIVYQNPSKPSIQQNINFLTSSVTASKYKWLLNDTVMVSDTLKTAFAPRDAQYKLTITDSNGCSATSFPLTFSYTPGVGISNVVSENSLGLYPNPAAHNFTIDYCPSNCNELNYNWRITGIDGKNIETGKGICCKPLQLSTKNLSDGIYIVEVEHQHIISQRKLTVQR